MKKLIFTLAFLTSTAFASEVVCTIDYNEAANGEGAVRIQEVAFQDGSRVFEKNIGGYSVFAVKGREGEIFNLSITDIEAEVLVYSQSLNESSKRKSVGTQNFKRRGESISVVCEGK